MKYVIYARKSTESEERQILSIEGQVSRILERFPDITDYEVIIEQKSAYIPDNRPKFSQVLKDLKKGKYQGLVSWHPDRLSRNPIDAGLIIHYLDQKWINDLRFVSYSFDNSPEGKMVLSITLSQSKYASEKMAVDVVRNMELKAQKGGWNHKAPVGYFNDMQTRTIILDKERAYHVKQIFRMRRQGRSLRKIAEKTNATGFRMPSGHELTARQVWKIVNNRFYAGFVTWRGTEYKGTHAPLVSEKMWKEAKKTNSHQYVETNTYFPFRGIVKCSVCGGMLTSEIKKGKYVYYKCAKGNGKCSGFIREEEMDKMFSDLLSRTEVDWEFVEEAKTAIRSFLKNERQYKEVEREKVSNHLSHLDERKTVLLDKLLDGVISNDIYEQKERELKKEIEKSNCEFKEINVRSAKDYEIIEKWIELMHCLKESYKTSLVLQKGILLKKLGSNYILKDGKLAWETPKTHLKVVQNTTEMFFGRAKVNKLELFENMFNQLFEHLDEIKTILAMIKTTKDRSTFATVS